MRRTLILLLTGALLAAATGCGSDPPPSGGTPPPHSETSPRSEAPLPSEASPPVKAPPPAEATPPTPEPSSGELPGGLPFGERNLIGVVERSGACTMLRVGTRLWGLTGTPVPGLKTGAKVAVSGQVTTPDPACGKEVTRGLVVHRATPA